MARTEIDALIHVLQQAFDGDVEHSLIANLEAVRDEDWHAVPARGSRSIYDIVLHVAECKWMYDHYAFREAAYRWVSRRSRLRMASPGRHRSCSSGRGSARSSCSGRCARCRTMRNSTASAG
jgi:hypothetical protein